MHYLLSRTPKSSRAAVQPATRIPAPWARGLSVDAAELVGLSPVTDVNRAVFELIDQQTAPATVGLFLVDPFLRHLDAIQRLRTAGVRAIANLPTVQLIDGEAGRALDLTQQGWRTEVDVLARYRDAGFGIVGVAAHEEAARAIIALSPECLVVHPGPALSDPARRLAATRAVHGLLDAIRDETRARSVPCILHIPAGYDGALDGAALGTEGVCRLVGDDRQPSSP
jgi:predicted TIM-barrel enzyme